MLHSLDPRELKRCCDFIAIASCYTELRPAGRQYRGLCPFHSERNPSLYIEPHEKIWKCFGCERGGDVFAFVMLAERCGFTEALRIVAGVARASEPRSGERFRARAGGEAPLAREAGVTHSPKERAELLARLDATEKRNAAIRAANEFASAEFATACEPLRGEAAYLLVTNRITGRRAQ